MFALAAFVTLCILGTFYLIAFFVAMERESRKSRAEHKLSRAMMARETAARHALHVQPSSRAFMAQQAVERRRVLYRKGA